MPKPKFNRQQLLTPLVLAFLCGMIAIFQQGLTSELAFHREAILDGEWWRLLTANFIHLNWAHTALNIAGIILIWGIFLGDISFRWELIFTVTAIIGTTISLLLFSPNLQFYVGLSGALHGIFVAFCLYTFPQHTLLSIFGVFAVAFKLTSEHVFVSNNFIENLIQNNVVVDSHLWGAISGLLAGIIYLLIKRSD